MNKFKNIFPKKNTLLVVIHVVDYEQAIRNITIAREAGTDGIFLISHHRLNHVELLELYMKAREEYPDFWMGINWLDLLSFEATALVTKGVCGLWVDNLGIKEAENGYDFSIAKANQWILKNKKWPGLYFGSVAFKYQQLIENPAMAAKAAMDYTDIIVTSGEATGRAPAIQKIISIREAIGDFPLAIASGITAKNVSQYMGIADCFMVSTGVSKDFYELDPELVEELAEKIRKGEKK